MCSIHGIIGLREKPPIELIQKMLNQSIKRGPDFMGIKQVHKQILFGSNRLSIQDISSSAVMPLTSSKTENTIVFNGEIYNQNELRKDLENLGYTFKTKSDTEVVLYGYEQYGKDIVNKLNGMFAFAIFNKQDNKIFLARDRYGTKPLFYYKNDEYFVFGSDIKGILELHSDFCIDQSTILSYMYFRFIPGEKTIIKDIFKLQPGCNMEFNVETNLITVNRYRSPILSNNENEEKFIEKIKNAVQLSTIGDSNFGVLLSGGLDSSSIVALLENLGYTNINTFSCETIDSKKDSDSNSEIGLISEKGNEIDYANFMAELYKTNHTVIQVSNEEMGNSFYDLIETLGEPIASTDALGHFVFANKIKNHNNDIKFLLSGTGADEILSGYTNLFFGENGEKLNKVNSFRDFLFFFSGQDLIPWKFESIVDEQYRSDEYINDLFQNLNFKYENLLEKTNLYNIFEINFDLPERELVQGDRIYMNSSLENRPVFLENGFVDYCLQLSAQSKYDNNQVKSIMYKKLEDYLPQKIIKRKKIPSLGTPKSFYESSWFQSLVGFGYLHIAK